MTDLIADPIDLIAKSHQSGEKTGTRKLKLETRNPDARNPDAARRQKLHINWRVLSKEIKRFL